MAKRLEWSTYAGGTAAAEGKYSYSARTYFGQYSIDPISSDSGRHLGYAATFSSNGRLTIPGNPGLWSTVNPLGTLRPFNGHEPKYRSPQEAKSAVARSVAHVEGMAGELAHNGAPRTKSRAARRRGER